MWVISVQRVADGAVGGVLLLLLLVVVMVVIEQQLAGCRSCCLTCGLKLVHTGTMLGSLGCLKLLDSIMLVSIG